jgi:8-oxo-dGTP pyrophosphatase MutT (NUDIX family)
MKGVVLQGDRVLLVRNERAGWELPGGRLEEGESPEECVRREVAEETGLDVDVHGVVDAWVYPVLPEQSVLVVSFDCSVVGSAVARISDEHDAIGWFGFDELATLPLPAGYCRAIERAQRPDGRRRVE